MEASKSKIQVIELNQLSVGDAEFMSNWQARAFSKRDAYNTWMTGFKYSENTEAHVLLCRALLDRGSVCGSIITTTDRLGIRVLFSPSQKNRVHDTTWRSGKDEAWDRFLEMTGGVEAFKKRCEGITAGYHKEMAAVLKEHGDKPAYSSAVLAVHPDHQGKGIGRAINDYTAKKAMDNGCRLYFATNLYNLPFYKHIGCTPVGQPWGCAFKVPEGYPAEAALTQLVDAGDGPK